MAIDHALMVTLTNKPKLEGSNGYLDVDSTLLSFSKLHTTENQMVTSFISLEDSTILVTIRIV